MDITDAEANPADAETPAPVEDAASAPEAEIEDSSTEQAEGGDSQDAEETDDLDELLKEATGTAGSDNPEDVEVEYEGKTFKVPPELKDALLRHADYTRKTMEVADQRKALEAEKQEVQTLRSISQEQFQAALHVHQAKAQMEALIATPLDDLSQEEVNTLRLNYNDLEQQVTRWSQHLEQITAAEEVQRSQQLAKAREKALSIAAKEIPNFTDERRLALETLAINMGADPKEMQSATEPAIYKLLHLADIGQKFIERQRKATKVEKAQASAPAPEVTGHKATASKDPDKMTTEEWMKWREKQVSR